MFLEEDVEKSDLVQRTDAHSSAGEMHQKQQEERDPVLSFPNIGYIWCVSAVCERAFGSDSRNLTVTYTCTLLIIDLVPHTLYSLPAFRLIFSLS